MNLSEKELSRLIKQGENESVEFKSSRVRPESLSREIVAFANTNGGTLIIGIEDDGFIAGVSLKKNFEEWVANVTRNNVVPAINIKTSKIEVNKKKLIVLSIPKGVDRPYQTIEDKYYLRVGSTNRTATKSELLRLFQASGVFHYDLTPVKNTSIKSLNLGKLDDYFQKYQFGFMEEEESQKKQLLQNIDVLTANNEATLGGLLIFGINPTKGLPQNGISFAYFKGTEIDDELLDKKVIEGTLDTQIDTLSVLLTKYLAAPSKIVGNKRIDSKAVYPEKVFRELITNAVVHRNYSISGSKTRVFLFEDRLEVISPGRLPNTITIEKLPYGVSFAVNPVVVKFMENLRYIDQLGRGLPMVSQEAKKAGKKAVFQELGEEFKVILEL